MIYARRYRVHEGTSGYTTVYEFESTAVPESAEWKEQQQHSSPKSPRMRQAMTHARGLPGCTLGLIPNLSLLVTQKVISRHIGGRGEKERRTGCTPSVARRPPYRTAQTRTNFWRRLWRLASAV